VPGSETAPGAASPWLLLPLLVAATACTFAAALFWPTFALRRPGRAWVDRAQRGPLRGAGAAIAGALLAQCVLTVPLAIVLAPVLGAPAAAQLHVDLPPPAVPVIDAQHARLQFVVPTHEAIGELQLRPQVGLPSGAWIGTTLDVLVDGERLPAGTVPIADDRQLARVTFASRVVRELTLVHTGGTVPLVFTPGTASVVGSDAHATAANAAWLALLALAPSFVALALGVFCGRAAGTPTVVAVVLAALLVQLVAGVGPFGNALLALFRGQWLGAEVVFQRCAPSLAVGCVAMILAMFRRPLVAR
jgi:hypothetical protein